MDEAEWNDFCFLLLSFLRSISFSRRHFPLSLTKSSLVSCIIALPLSPSFIFLAISFSLLPLHSVFIALSLIPSFLSPFPLSRFRAISLDSSGVHLLFPISRVFSLSRHFLKSYSSSPFRYFYSSPIAFSSAFLPRHFSV